MLPPAPQPSLPDADALRPNPSSIASPRPSREPPPWPGLQAAAVGAYTCLWAALLSCTAQWTCSANLLELPLGGTDHTDGDPPPFFNLLAEARGDDPPTPTASLEDRGSDDVSNGVEKVSQEKKLFHISQPLL